MTVLYYCNSIVRSLAKIQIIKKMKGSDLTENIGFRRPNSPSHVRKIRKWVTDSLENFRAARALLLRHNQYECMGSILEKMAIFKQGTHVHMVTQKDGE